MHGFAWVSGMVYSGGASHHVVKDTLKQPQVEELKPLAQPSTHLSAK